MSEEKKDKEQIKSKSNQITLPEGVINKEEYLHYAKLCADPKINEEIFFDTSDGQRINLMGSMHHIKRFIAGLPNAEQETVTNAVKERKSLIATLNLVKRKAFGLKGIRAKNEESILSRMLKERSTEMLELFGRFYSTTEVHKIVCEDWGYTDVNIRQIREFKEKNDQLIKERQESFKADYSDLRLGYKRSRLDELHYLYNECKQKWENGNQNREDYKLLLITIEQIRKEREGDKITIDGNMSLSIEHTFILEKQKELLSELSITTLIMSNLCGKLNMDPKYYLAKLHSSYYARFNNFIGAPEYGEEILYPSDVPYDFEQIKLLNEKKKKEEVIVLNKPIEEKQEKKANLLRDLLLNAVMSKKSSVRTIEERLQGFGGGEEEFTQVTNTDIVKKEKKAKKDKKNNIVKTIDNIDGEKIK